MPSTKPTRYAIICSIHGQVFLTREEYDKQMARPDSRWICPVPSEHMVDRVCGEISQFDDDNYDDVRDEEELQPYLCERCGEPIPEDSKDQFMELCNSCYDKKQEEGP